MSDRGPLLLPPPDGYRYIPPDPEPLDGKVHNEGELGAGDLNSPHSDEYAAKDLRGDADAVNLDGVDERWVLKRLVKEATDFGARTRQSSRVVALKLIGEHFAMFTKVIENRDPVREALKDLTPWERKERIIALAAKLAVDPKFKESVVSTIVKGKGIP